MKLPGAAPVSARRLVAGLAALGITLRLIDYLLGISLWGDEAMLGLNLGIRSFSQLLLPLDYAQLAPVPFLWAERVMVLLAGGPGEYALRLLPLLTGCLVVLGTAWLGRRLLAPWEWVLAVGLVATSYFLIRYSTEVKPYALDALVTLGVTALTLDLLSRPDSRPAWLRLAGGGLAGVLCSTTGILVAGASVSAISLQGWRTRQWRIVGLAASLGSVWAVVFLAAYFAWYRPMATSPYMRQFWEAGLLRPGSPDLAGRFWGGVEVTAQGVVDWVVLIRLTPVAVAVAIAGVVVLWRRCGPSTAVMLSFPVIAGFIAAAAGAYPLSTRTMLFSLPSLAMIGSAGVIAAAHAVQRRLPSVRAPVVGTAMLIPSVVTAVATPIVRPLDEEMRPVVRELERRWHAGDVVYVMARSAAAWMIYTTDWRHPDRARLEWFARVAGPDGPGAVNGSSRGPRPRGEGWDLTRPFRGGRELFGTSSGIQVRQWTGYSSWSPDSGWADNEAARIRAAAAPRAWLVMINTPHGPECTSLLEAIRRQDAESLSIYRVGNAEARLFRFPR